MIRYRYRKAEYLLHKFSNSFRKFRYLIFILDIDLNKNEKYFQKGKYFVGRNIYLSSKLLDILFKNSNLNFSGKVISIFFNDYYFLKSNKSLIMDNVCLGLVLNKTYLVDNKILYKVLEGPPSNIKFNKILLIKVLLYLILCLQFKIKLIIKCLLSSIVKKKII